MPKVKKKNIGGNPILFAINAQRLYNSIKTLKEEKRDLYDALINKVKNNDISGIRDLLETELKNIDSNSSKDLKSKIEKVKQIYDSIPIKELIKMQDNFQKLLGLANSENIKELANSKDIRKQVKGLGNSKAIGEQVKGLGNSKAIGEQVKELANSKDIRKQVKGLGNSKAIGEQVKGLGNSKAIGEQVKELANSKDIVEQVKELANSKDIGKQVKGLGNSVKNKLETGTQELNKNTEKKKNTRGKNR